MRALLLVDHGSRRAEANAALEAVRARLETALSGSALVGHAHMELAAPDIATAIDDLCARGASSIHLLPWFLAPGRHVSEDVPRLARDALAGRDVALTIDGPLGAEPELITLALRRFG